MDHGSPLQIDMNSFRHPNVCYPGADLLSVNQSNNQTMTTLMTNHIPESQILNKHPTENMSMFLKRILKAHLLTCIVATWKNPYKKTLSSRRPIYLLLIYENKCFDRDRLNIRLGSYNRVKHPVDSFPNICFIFLYCILTTAILNLFLKIHLRSYNYSTASSPISLVVPWEQHHVFQLGDLVLLILYQVHIKIYVGNKFWNGWQVYLPSHYSPVRHASI